MRGDILNAGDNVDDQENLESTESYFVWLSQTMDKVGSIPLFFNQKLCFDVQIPSHSKLSVVHSSVLPP